MRNVPVIDAHHHFWQVARQPHPWRTNEHAVLDRDFEPDELARELPVAGVDTTVLVQSADLPEENRRMLEYARQAPFVSGIVAWAPLQDAAAAREQLDQFAGHHLVKGVRCLIGRSDPRWLTSARTVEVFEELADRGMTWDVVPVTAPQTELVCAVAQAVPRLRIVVDHLARPPLDTGDTDATDAWEARVRALSGLPNVAVKLSVGIDVLTGWPAWSAGGLLRPVAHALSCFGPERAMLASNWPVVTLRRTYRSAWSDVRGAVSAALPDDPAARAQVCGGTAMRWYGL